MSKSSLFISSLIIAVSLTFVSTTISYYKQPKMSRSPASYDQVSGFPFELGRRFSPTTVILKSSQVEYPINPYILTFTFWFLGSLALLLWLRHFKGKRALIFVGIIAFSLMLIDIKTSFRCLGGYPVGFISSCLDVTSPNNPLWFFAMLNYSFWLVIALVGSFILLNAKNSSVRLIKLFIPPLIVTLFSLIFQASCDGLFCLFYSGRGFPFPFTGDGALVFLSIDYIFWWIVYNRKLLRGHKNA